MLDCVKSTGKTVKKIRSIDSFTAIDLDDRINLYISYSTELKLEVEAGENLQKLIKTKVENGVLKIRNENRCNWVRSYKRDINVYLSTPELNEITYYGSGELRFTNMLKTDWFILNMWEASGNIDIRLDCPNVELKSHTGPADLQCGGFTNRLVAYTNGLGRMDLSNLIAKDVLAINVNSGSLKVRSDSLLKATIEGSGDIFYRGNPTIEFNDLGSGELIPSGN